MQELPPLGSEYLARFWDLDKPAPWQTKTDVLGQKEPELINLAVSDGPADTWDTLKLSPELNALAYSLPGGGILATRQLVSAAHGVSEASKVGLFCGGTSQANALVISALVHKGGRVLAEDPIYEPLVAAVRTTHADNWRTIGGASPEWRVPRRPEDNFQIRLEEWKACLSTRPRLILLTQPHNPSGVYIQNLSDLLRAVETHNRDQNLAEDQCCYVLVDEVQREVTETPAPCAAALSPYAVATSSVTKAYGLSGARVRLLSFEDIVC